MTLAAAASTPDDSVWSEVGVVAGALVAVCVLVGLAVRYVLVPYLEKYVVTPVTETHRQVTPHPNASLAEPTVLDRLDDVRDAVDRLNDTTIAVQAIANAAARSVAGAHRRIDQHNAWSDVEVGRLWSAVMQRRRERGGEHNREKE